MTKRGIPRGVAAGALAAALTLTAACVKQKTVRWKTPAFASIWNLKVGSGATYKAACGWGDPSRIGIAIVGEQAVGSHRGYWLEVSFARLGPSRTFATKSLFYLNRKHVNFVRAVVQVPGHPPVEAPADWMANWTIDMLARATGYVGYQEAVLPAGDDTNIPGITNLPESTDPEGYVPDYFLWMSRYPSDLPKAKLAGAARVATPGGKFTTQHWRFKRGDDFSDVWLARKAGPFGVVQAQLGHPAKTERGPVVAVRVFRGSDWAYVALTGVLRGATDKIGPTAERVEGHKLLQWLGNGTSCPCFSPVC